MYFGFIKAKKNASPRTKNRIKEQGPCFLIKRKDRSSPWFDNQAVVLLQSKIWAGWIPLSEIVIEPVSIFI